MNTVTCEYDPWRGGFEICFAKFDRKYSPFFELMSGEIKVYTTVRSKILCIESFFADRGGLRLSGMNRPFPKKGIEGKSLKRNFFGPNLTMLNGKFSLGPEGGQFGPVEVKQSMQTLDLLFDCPEHVKVSKPTLQRGVCIYPGICGVILDFSFLVVQYPLESIEFRLADFK